MKKLILILIVIISQIENIEAHSDIIKVRTFDNIVVSIKTGYVYEEIDKAWILGQLAAKLSKEYGFNDTIFINIEHNYVESINPIYLISYSRGFDFRYYSYDFFKNNEIELFLNISDINIESYLKLIEYIIVNKEFIKLNTKEIETTELKERAIVYSIDQSLINDYIKKESSSEIVKLLKSKTYRIEVKKDFCGLSYYYSCSYYNFYIWNNILNDSIVFSAKNFVRLNQINRSTYFLFDTDSSFYYISGINTNELVIKHKVIRNLIVEWYSYPLEFSEINQNYYYLNNYNSDKFIETETFPGFIEKERDQSRLVIYDSKRDILIQDLDKIIEKNFR